ncbi:hypothetical protein [Sigmofec virus UA08Rod_4820]|uniref:Uncharacterized protein n=1 Tax=Sigmofec virus UA08Rod_4820 TaxID=2929410 RepID=A0A976R816_9VIRU|nr:hypothetical protein [Sigmofec virus UA08Rod_4820]
MKNQLILRLIPGVPSLLDATIGSIIDEQFKPDPALYEYYDFSNHIVVTDLLGTQGYLRYDSLYECIRDKFDLIRDVSIYPNFIVLDLKPYDSSKIKKEER